MVNLFSKIKKRRKILERLVKKIKWSDINSEYKDLNLDDFYMVDDVSFENLIEIQKILEKL